ncbi:M1 family metallopeptidase [Ornithinimicrobium sp. F0845]|uniref:M1 family metallopeptidase n=1 Tax=Ornithinimicrobium sp. F0845 TaxID=2926412 RepID=UPI001FF5794E|nr:M1 family metallopeptidase [Ornithinimicrobium sp. F0845]MCK0112620.1 M1 family metallopeptidase [Ornithinimicrobium sp. F0845]
MTASPLRLALAGTAAVALTLTPALAGAAPGRPGEPRFQEGADGAGDPYFPLAGNGGIDVLHYDLDLTYQLPDPAPAPLEGQLDGVATIELRATQDLHRFNLDLRGLTASEVVVDGKSMRFDQVENELRVSPRPKLKTGDEVTVEITYGGTTTRPTDIEGALYGWVTTRDGAMVVSEPDGSATWFPVSDHPTDKATYAYEITVPEGSVAVANGLLEGSETNDGWTTWTWDAPDPMAAYLATATVGDFELDSYVAANGTQIIDAVDPGLPASASASLALTSDMLVFFEDAFGPYPFNSYGAIVDDDSVGYALETQTRSFFSRRAAEGTVAHELAHQWMGNHVSPGRWADIWLNEGWASYSSWMWSEEQGRTTAQENFEDVMSTPADDGFWDVVVAEPGPLCLFCGAIYDRGAATLHALRVEIGDGAFFELAKTWVAEFGGGTATTADFTALAEGVSGQDLEGFFDVWLYTPEKPTTW